MSGFEIAGAVLGILPLLFEGAKAAQFYLEGIDRWWQFRTDFEALVRAIMFEEVIFAQNLNLLLTPLELSDKERSSLKHSHTSSLWHHPDIVGKIRHHLEEALPLFTRMLRELNDSLDELYKLLPIKKGEVCLPTSRSVESEVMKLCTSFSRKRGPVLEKIHTTNQQLERILRNAKDIKSMARASPASPDRTSSSTVHVTSFVKLQKQSQVLYRVLKSGLSCSCNDQHRCGISARWEKSKLDSKGPSLNLLIDDRQGRKQVRWEVEAADRAVPPTPRDEQHSLDQIYELDLEFKLQGQKKGFVKAAQGGKPLVAALSSFATVTNPLSTKTERTWTNTFKKLQKPAKAINSALKSSPGASSKQTQTVQIQAAQVQVTQTAQKRVQIAGPAAPTAPKMTKPRVTDVCSFIKAPPQNDRFLGTMEADYHDINFYHEPRSQQPLSEAQNETMETFWASTKDLAMRLQVGLSIAVTLLSLGTSAWIPRGWCREDVFLMRCIQDGGGRMWTFGPYFNHPSLSLTLREEPMSARLHAEAAIFSLGVLLLELRYRTPLERSPYWGRYCPGGQRNDFTDTAAAHDWYEELASDPAFEEGLAEPVRRCLEISFSAPADLGSSEFLRDVFETVIEPLEEFIDQYSGGAVGT
ncbi:hypothetical protein GQ53DRAFT_836870 [Thozetella sp. PMI_491]|nr:hypothetical protein GQ53DRAFT_836870 [Thozetella sp. PMI_491]